MTDIFDEITAKPQGAASGDIFDQVVADKPFTEKVMDAAKSGAEVVGHLRKPKPLGMGLQVPRGLDTQVPEKGFVWPTASAYGGNSAGIGQAEGE